MARMFATSATTTSAGTTTAAAGPLFPRAGFVHRQRPAVKLRAIQSLNGLLRFFRRCHGDESETTRPAGRAIRHQVRLDDRAMRRKGVL